MLDLHDLSSFSDIDECLEDPCHSNATCNNTDGSFICSCNTGYTGNGTTCTSKLLFYVNTISVFWYIVNIYIHV